MPGDAGAVAAVSAPLRGGCSCGTIRYEASGAPFHETLCHCSNFRRTAGAPAAPWSSVSRAGFRFVAGEPATFRSSTRAQRRFCIRCGTQLADQADGAPEELDVTTSSLDDPARVPPRDHTWVGSRIGWHRPGDDLPCFPGRRGSR